MSQNRAIITTIIVTAIVVSIGWLGFAGSVYWMLVREPPNFEVEVQAPDLVKVGETFPLVVTVSNPEGERLDLRSIDFSDDLLKGFELLSIDPVPSPKRKFLGYLSCYYRPAKSDSRFSVTMKLRAKEVGIWGGDIDSCTLLENFISRYTEVQVVAADAAAGGPKTAPDASPSLEGGR